MLDVAPCRILAAFTFARRRHEGLTQAALARRLGIRPDQVSRAESGRPCGAVALARLREWNEIAQEVWSGTRVAESRRLDRDASAPATGTKHKEARKADGLTGSIDDG